MTLLIISTSVAIVGIFICSLFEAVFYSVPTDYIESLDQQGRPAGKLLKNLRKDVQRPISAILIINTLAMSACGAVAGAAAAEVFGSKWVPAFSLVFCLVLLVISEVIPKTAGVVYSRPLAVLVARPLHLLVWILSPLVYFCQLFIRVIFGGRQQEHTISVAELVTMARLGHLHGEIDEHEADVIENILKLEDETVRDVMTPRSVLFILDADMTVSEARRTAGSLLHSRIPLHDENTHDVVGIVHRRQILSEMAAGRNPKLEDLMRLPHFVPDTMPLDELLIRFIDRCEHLFVVIDEFGTIVGIVTLEDVLEEILGREIVDDIEDENEDLREVAKRRREEILNGGK
ncbi:MAG: hemolysin family protein [Planctomycetota bacterium]|nr:hemolysin family protein [Planctomycetota bacterium]MDA1142066.1 hemolysin family protein [Planctomycetota bacterium]